MVFILGLMKSSIVLKNFFLLGIGSMFVFHTALAGYTDVSVSHPHYTAIKYFGEKGYMKGYSDGTFGVEKQINRVEALKTIIATTEESLVEGSNTFSDVSSSAWFLPFVNHAIVKGIVSSSSETGQFFPHRPVNLAEFFKMVLAAFEVDPSVYQLNVSLKDVPDEAWFAPSLLFGVQFGILEPDDEGNIFPDRPVTRSLAAHILYQTLYKGNGLKDPQLFASLTERHLVYALDVLKHNDVMTAGFSVVAAKKYSQALLSLTPDNVTAQAVSLTVEAVNSLVGAYAAAENALFEDVVKAAQNAWRFADQAEQTDPLQMREMAVNIKLLASSLADKAREALEAHIEFQP